MNKKILWLVLLLAVPFGLAGASDYLLGAGDVIKVVVYEHEDLTTEDRISERGDITFPLIGEVHIGGLSKFAAEALLTKLLIERELVKNPQVNIKVEQYASHLVSVLGNVNKPGTFPLNTDTSLLEMIAQAGGISPQGDERAIVVREEGGKTRKFEVDLRAVFEQGVLEGNVRVENKDIIYVPRARLFYVYGEVQRPGVYHLERAMTVKQALSVGGGLTPRGTDNGIKITRRSADGQIVILETRHDDLLQADDVITIKERLF